MQISKRVLSVLLIFVLSLSGIFIYGCSSGSKQTTSNNNANKTSLFGTMWVIQDLNGKRVLMPEGSGEFYLTLTSEGTAVGMSGCNNYTGKASVSGSSIKFGPLAGTKKFCEGIMETEDKYLAALEVAKSFKINGNTLSLMDASKNVIVTFTGFKATGTPGEN